MKKSHHVSGGGQGVLWKGHTMLVEVDRECYEKSHHVSVGGQGALWKSQAMSAQWRSRWTRCMWRPTWDEQQPGWVCSIWHQPWRITAGCCSWSPPTNRPGLRLRGWKRSLCFCWQEMGDGGWNLASLFILSYFILQLDCPLGISSMGDSAPFHLQKPAMTEVCYPNYSVFCFFFKCSCFIKLWHGLQDL